MSLEELKKEYATQDNRMTAYPIYVTVQELVCIGVMADGYSVNCPYGDGKTVTRYRFSDGDCDSPDCESKEELLKEAKENGWENPENEEIMEYQVGYIWHPVEFFLTIKGAEQYMKANAHNHGELRTYVHWFERRNFEMRELLEEMGFKTRDELKVGEAVRMVLEGEHLNIKASLHDLLDTTQRIEKRIKDELAKTK